MPALILPLTHRCLLPINVLDTVLLSIVNEFLIIVVVGDRGCDLGWRWWGCNGGRTHILVEEHGVNLQVHRGIRVMLLLLLLLGILRILVLNLHHLLMRLHHFRTLL